MNAVRLKLKQRTPEWLDARRELITGTDIPAILGVSPYRSEADVAREKRDGAQPVDVMRMRVGTALEPLIAKEYETATGRRVVRADGIWTSRTWPWAAASLDYRCRSYDRIVECKWTSSRSRFADGLPQDVEAQVRWQLGVTGVHAADVAVLVGGEELKVLTVEHDAALFRRMVEVAESFRHRLADGGPFEHNADSVRRAHPADDGSEADAEPDVAEAVERLLAIRAERVGLEKAEEQLETAIKTRMGERAVLRGPAWRVVWKRGKDRTETDWKALADAYGRWLTPSERESLHREHTVEKPGTRPFRVVFTEEGPQ